ncbi:MAG: glycosyltransferase family 9 protein [Caldimicrobium sp.]
MKILIIKLSALGDVLQTLPALAQLKRELPFAEIDWAVEERNSELLMNHPYINKLLLFRKDCLQNIFKFWHFFSELRLKKYTAVIDFQGLLKSALLVFFAKSYYKIGFSNHREGSPFFYNLKFSPYDPEMHAVKRYLLLAKKSYLFLLTGKEIEPEVKEIPRDIPLPEEIPPFFQPQKPYLLLIPSARWESKIWPFEYWNEFLQLSQNLRKRYDFYFIGGKDKDLQHFTELMAQKHSGVYSMVGKTHLRELVYIMRGAEAVISVDTGTMHLASLLNKPILALFGPTAENRTGPWSDKFLVLSENLACQPCFKKKCTHKTCLFKLTPDRVYRALKDFLHTL